MKSMIQKTLSAAAVALAFGFGFVSTGWAGITKTIDAGQVIDGTARAAYDVSGEAGFSLADIGTKYFPRVRFDGTAVDYDGIEAYVCNRYPATGADANGKVRYEAQFVDQTTSSSEKWLKCAVFEFSLDGNNLMVQWKTAKYAKAADHHVGERFLADDGTDTDIATGTQSNTAAYGIRD